MRILVGCELSGVVRNAFAKRGHDAVSCDLRPTDDDGGWHYHGDVRDILGWAWDMAIFHPDCTHLAVSGAHRFREKRADGRQQAAIDFFMLLANCRIPKICIENPICIMSSVWRKPDQIVQPNQFGHDASKATCLWLKGLPKLTPTRSVEPRIVNGMKRWANQTDSGQNKLGPSEDRAKIRSRTYEGLAQAMAEQWG